MADDMIDSLNARLAEQVREFALELDEHARTEGDALVLTKGARLYVKGSRRGEAEIEGEPVTLVHVAQLMRDLTPETAVTFCEFWLSGVEEEEETKIVAMPEMSAAVPTEPSAVATPSIAIESEQKPLTLAEAQAIAESIVGPVHWRGDDGLCRCPGEDSHTTPTAATDCKVVCMPMPLEGGILAPGIYRFHGSCAGAREDASHKLRSALGKRTAASGGIVAFRSSPPSRPPAPSFSLKTLRRVAAKLDGVDDNWLAERSPICVDNRTPASFLHALYQPGEKVSSSMFSSRRDSTSGSIDRHRSMRTNSMASAVESRMASGISPTPSPGNML